MKSKNDRPIMDWNALREKLGSTAGRTYWRSLSELSETAEFQDYLKHEFPAHADTWTDPVGRRQFLKLMGASFAFAGLTACTMQPEERLVPFVKAPEELIPGRPQFYASAAPFFGYGQGVLVESHDGRPTKIEGNPKHPASLGGTSVLTQASVLDLYDPDRLTYFSNQGRVRTAEIFAAEITSRMEQFRLAKGQGLRILTENVTSPTLGALLNQLLREYPEARWHQWEPANRDNVRQGALTAFGKPANTIHRFDRASVVLALDADFMFCGPAAVRNAKDFSRFRRVESPQSEMNRLYAADSAPNVSSSVADHRLRLRPSQFPALARALAAALGVDVVAGESPDPAAQKWVEAVAKDLQANRGKSLVLAGDHLPGEIHALCHLINQALGNVGETVVYTEPVEVHPESHLESLRDLVEASRNGTVETLLILGGNPAFNAPADFEFTKALSRIGFKVHLTPHENETSVLCDWKIPETHYLEGWGDIRAFDGSVSIIQPLIQPLYDSRSPIEIASLLLGRAGSSGYDQVRDYWKATVTAGDFEGWWRSVLHQGLVPNSALPPVDVTVDVSAVRQALAALSGTAVESGLEVVFRPDPHIYDGRLLNNGWLQEAPKPLTKLTWDNAVLVAPATAEKLGLEQEEVVDLTVGGVTVRGPLWIQPGQPEDTVTLHFGYGRKVVGTVGSGAGFDVFPLRTSEGLWLRRGALIASTGTTYKMACTQEHSSMEGRNLVRENTLTGFRKEPDFAHEHAEVPGSESDLYPGWKYEGHAWGMAVDLSACIGCNACIVACQSENNIAVVGRDEVRNGREMHWIRLDRYFAGSLDDPDTLHQPIMCQHCENAPCESVCPVGATVHSSEGLNDMVYNRCVGTRYCSNNCPYKVRRFNFLLYSDWDTETFKLQRNPNVTVRSRGVMEKCTYCVQRINAAKIDAKVGNHELKDGDIKTACQQVCPTDAIVFGDVNDPESRVSKLKKSERNYGILTELKTVPRTSYLARITNPNPELEKSEEA